MVRLRDDSLRSSPAVLSMRVSGGSLVAGCGRCKRQQASHRFAVRNDKVTGPWRSKQIFRLSIPFQL